MAFMLSNKYGSGLREIKGIDIYMNKWNGHAEIGYFWISIGTWAPSHCGELHWVTIFC